MNIGGANELGNEADENYELAEEMGENHQSSPFEAFIEVRYNTHLNAAAAVEFTSIENFMNQCIEAIGNTTAHDISVSINDGEFKASFPRHRPIQDRENKCRMATSLALQVAFSAGIRPSKKKYILNGMAYGGRAYGIGIFAEGNSIQELLENCKNNLPNKLRLNNLKISLNGQEMKEASNRYNWNRNNLCEKAVSLAFEN